MKIYIDYASEERRVQAYVIQVVGGEELIRHRVIATFIETIEGRKGTTTEKWQIKRERDTEAKNEVAAVTDFGHLVAYVLSSFNPVVAEMLLPPVPVLFPASVAITPDPAEMSAVSDAAVVTREDMEALYWELSGIHADGRWGDETLEREIAELQNEINNDE